MSCDTHQIDSGCCVLGRRLSHANAFLPAWGGSWGGDVTAINGVCLLLLEGMEWGSDFRDGFGRDELLLFVPVVMEL